MPTRLVVLLQSRKSAAAGSGGSTITPARGPPKRGPERAPVKRQHGTWCKLIGGPSVLHRSRRRDFAQAVRGCQPQVSTRIARKSFTLVQVGPGLKRLSRLAKNSVELLSLR